MWVDGLYMQLENPSPTYSRLVPIITFDRICGKFLQVLQQNHFVLKGLHINAFIPKAHIL